MNTNATELTVSTEVLEKMAAIAATEVEGVAGIAKRAVDLKDAVKNRSAFTGVKAESENGAIVISVYITLRQDAKAQAVAEAVQKNIKEKIQNMTGTAVTRVNVTVADIAFDAPAAAEKPADAEVGGQSAN